MKGLYSPKDTEYICSVYAFFSKLDMPMQYYTLELDESTRNCAPFAVSSAVTVTFTFLWVLHNPCILYKTEWKPASIGSFVLIDSHTVLLATIPNLLKFNNFTINPFQCEWGISWVGCWLWQDSTWNKKIEAILAFQQPQTVIFLRSSYITLQPVS
jgi:hypothetical protein